VSADSGAGEFSSDDSRDSCVESGDGYDWSWNSGGGEGDVENSVSGEVDALLSVDALMVGRGAGVASGGMGRTWKLLSPKTCRWNGVMGE
jgi:hypothetical protein